MVFFSLQKSFLCSSVHIGFALIKRFH
jgi:hypothetical protein